MSVHADPHDRPTAAEVAPQVTVPMWVSLRVCECGRVGEYAHTRCGENGRHNMRRTCPTVTAYFVPVDDEGTPL